MNKITEYKQFKHGVYVGCDIRDTHVVGRIGVTKAGTVYFCNNFYQDGHCKEFDLQEYKLGLTIAFIDEVADEWCGAIKNLHTIPGYENSFDGVQKLQTLFNTFCKEYSNPSKTMKTLSKSRYMKSGEYFTDGYIAFRDVHEPIDFRQIRAKESTASIKDKFDEVVNSDKRLMSIDRVAFNHGSFVVVLKCDEFESHVNPKYLGLVTKLKYPLRGVRLWQKDAMSPILVESSDNVPLMIIMPIKVLEGV